jgi:putative membrane protein
MPEPHDPRVVFASERTLLAWVRTGVSVVGLGFVVAKFGMSLEGHVGVNGDPTAFYRSLAIGVALVVLGGVATAYAAWHHRHVCQTLGPEHLPPTYSFHVSVWFSLTLAIMSLLLAGHLLIRTEHAMTPKSATPAASDTR